MSPCLRLSRWGRAPPPRGLPNSRRSGWGPRSGHGGFGVWRGPPPSSSQAASHRGDLAWRKAREGSLGAPYRDPNPITGPRDLVAAQGPRLLTSAGQDSTCGLWGRIWSMTLMVATLTPCVLQGRPRLQVALNSCGLAKKALGPVGPWRPAAGQPSPAQGCGRLRGHHHLSGRVTRSSDPPGSHTWTRDGASSAVHD